MTELDGQLDALDLLDEKPPQPTFTVYEMTAELGWGNQCGWFGRPGFQGGGATRWPDNQDLSIAYNYCQRCIDKHGHPRVHKGGTPLRLVTYAEYSAKRKKEPSHAQ